ncbi:MAG: cadmium-translocating P-type ATPase [Clostridiales bacterium]|nr:cadmium-translocating P-type ATPase [Clostridiales bacterium]
MRKELVLEGLDCASCASKIELKVRELKGVELANLNFITKTLAIEINDNYSIDSIMESTGSIINKLEPHVIIKDKSTIKDPSIYHDSTSHCDGHCHIHEDSHNHSEEFNKYHLIRFGIGIIFFIMALLLKTSGFTRFLLYFTSYILIGGNILLIAGRNILNGQIFDENFLMTIATIGAFAIGEYPEGVAVMLFYQIGELFQDSAVNRSRKSIAELMDIRPDYANLKTDNGSIEVRPEKVKIGDIIIVKPGEKVPLDGVVIEGESMMDTSALTGESVPRKVNLGKNVLAGFININGLLSVQVKKEFGESTVSKILELVENASGNKAPTENFITRFARYYTPVVVFIAMGLALIPPLIIDVATFSEWLYRALVFLVISCPCALVVSIPLGFFGGIGGASRNGVLVKGGNYLEALKDIDTVVFDKTGTLTKGIFEVTEFNPHDNISHSELLEYAAYAEAFSNHPIAKSILNAYGGEIDKELIEDYNEIAGHGIEVKVKGKTVLVGNTKLMESKDIVYEPIDSVGTVIYIAVDNSFMGSIIISDELKEDSKDTISKLKSMGIRKTVMLTGDNELVGRKIGNDLGIDEIYTELLPQDKVEILEKLEKEKSSKGNLVFVGDGINDAPVLARADIGVAMGGLGSDAAIEAADVVLMTDEPNKLITAIKIAKKTNNIVWQNIIFAFGVKLIVLLLGAGGLANMWEAVFADVGVALIAIFNAMRVLNTKNI